MPILPTYDSKNNIQANISAPVRNEVDQPFKDMQNVVGAVQGITQSWSNAHDVMQATEAQANHSTALAELESKAAADQNFRNSQEYFTQLDEINKNAVAGIDNKLVAEKISLELKHDADIAKIKIQNNFNKKELDNNKFTTTISLENLMAQRSEAMTQAEKDQYDLKINQLMNAQVSSNALSQEDAYKILIDAKKANVIAGIFNNPDMTISELKDKNGFYKDLPEYRKAIFIERAKEYKQKQERESTELQKEIVYNNEVNIAMGFAQGQVPNIKNLAEMERKGVISSDFANIALKVATSKYTVNSVTNNEEFSKLTREIFNSTEKGQVQKSIKNILKGGSDGKLSKEDLETLLTSAKAQGSERRGDLSNGVKTLNDWAEENKKVNRAEMYRTYQQSINSGKNVQDAISDSMKINTLKVRPDFMKFPPEGKMQKDKFGNKAMVFPDGRIEEIK